MLALMLSAAVSGGSQTTNPVSIPFSLEIASKCAPIVSAFVALAGVVFISYQIVLVRRSHQTSTFLKILDMARDKNFAEAVNWVKYKMDTSINYDTARANDQAWSNISQVIHFFESLGILVQRNFINRDLVFDQMGTWIAGTWSKVKPLIVVHRATKGYPEYAENFEILVEKFDEWAKKNQAKKERRPRLGVTGAANYYGVPADAKPEHPSIDPPPSR